MKYDYSHLTCRDISYKNVIFWACNEVGDRTSISFLIEKACQIWELIAPGEEPKISYQTCLFYRRHWRKKTNSNVDCRTYIGQPDRNMVVI